MLVRVTAEVEEVGTAYEIVELSRMHRLGAIITEVLQEIERAHPGASVLDHHIAIRSEPAKGEPGGPILIR